MPAAASRNRTRSSMIITAERISLARTACTSPWNSAAEASLPAPLSPRRQPSVATSQVWLRSRRAARAALATAERYNLTRQPQLALANAEQAMMGIPVGTPDWLRAQDIAMVSRSEVERQRRNR